MDAKQLTELLRKLFEIQLMMAEEQLTMKKVRWYEIIIVGGAGITIGLALARIFLVP